MSNSHHWVLVGGQGYIGRHLAMALNAHGASTTVIDPITPGTKLPEFINALASEIELAHLCNLSELEFVIIYLAASSTNTRGLHDPDSLISLELRELGAAIQLSHQLNCKRFVYLSSAAVYTESVDFRSPYGQAKSACEQKIIDQVKIPFSIARVFNVIGTATAAYNKALLNRDRLPSNIVRSAIDESIVLTLRRRQSAGETIFPSRGFVLMNDAVNALIELGTDRSSSNFISDLKPTDSISIWEIADIISELFPSIVTSWTSLSSFEVLANPQSEYAAHISRPSKEAFYVGLRQEHEAAKALLSR